MGYCEMGGVRGGEKEGEVVGSVGGDRLRVSGSSVRQLGVVTTP